MLNYAVHTGVGVAVIFSSADGRNIERNAASVFVIGSEPFMTRRVQWIFRREFSGLPAKISVQPFDPPGFSLAGWWKTEQGSTAFQNEILKYLYYRWKY